MAKPYSEELKRQWEKNILKQRQSKLSIASWCRQNNLAAHVFYYWQSKLSAKPTFERSSFLEAVEEKAVRPLAIGRKNWLFFGSFDGGEAGAILFSLVQTCRGLGISPREYLEDVMRGIMGHNSQKLHELLPDEWLKNRIQNHTS